jgi:hypothetical protein
MARIILDIGSGNTCQNDPEIARRMIAAVAAVDTKKHEVIFKAQLFQYEPPNIPMNALTYDKINIICNDYGYDLTASVFNLESLKFLLSYNPRFIKIANRRSLDWLATRQHRPGCRPICNHAGRTSQNTIRRQLGYDINHRRHGVVWTSSSQKALSCSQH